MHNITGLPWPERATVDRNRLILTFDEALDKNSVPAASAFTVKVNGSAVSLVSINPVAITGNAVTLTLAAAVNTGDTVAVSYASPSTNPLRNAVGAVRDFADVSATLLNSVPWVEGVAISSDPGDDGAYALGENIHVELSFSEAVDVDTTGGAPRLKIKLDPDYGEKWATYESGDGTKTLVFAYTVADPNRSDQGVAVLRNTLELNGGAIRSTTTMAANAHLRHEGLDHDPSHLVNGTIPKLQGATADGTRLVLTYDEALDENSVPAGNAFTVKVNGSVASLAVDAPVDVRSSSVTLTLATAVAVSDVVTVSYTRPTTDADQKLRDRAGNEAASFSDRPAGPDTIPPRLVRGEIVRETMTLYFSEALDEDSFGGYFRMDLQLSDSTWGTFTAEPREVGDQRPQGGGGRLEVRTTGKGGPGCPNVLLPA